jgi:peptidylprolyl isomerase domain and WD repeat-containing protein 1
MDINLVSLVNSFEYLMLQVRVFKFQTGKLSRVFDESLQRFSELQQLRQQLPNMEFGRR